jgi:hypothetical protein
MPAPNARSTTHRYDVKAIRQLLRDMFLANCRDLCERVDCGLNRAPRAAQHGDLHIA